MAQETDTTSDSDYLQLRCNPEFKRNLRVEAAKAGKSMSQYVRDTLRSAWNGAEIQDKGPYPSDAGQGSESGDYEERENNQEPDKSESRQGYDAVNSEYEE